jgi:hypothetical protein
VWLNKGRLPEKSMGAFADLGYSNAPRDVAAMTETSAICCKWYREFAETIIEQPMSIPIA